MFLETTDEYAVITLNRPRAYNAVNQDLAGELLESLIACAENAEVRAVLITGHGPAFCAGGDIRQMQAYVERDGHAGRFLKTLTVALHAVQ